jgi:predicted membrane protein
VIGVIALLAFIHLMDSGEGQTAIFGGVDRHISAQDFHGAQCTAIFGGCKIDLRDAQIQGNEAVLETYAIFGGVEIRVPRDWEVVNRSVAIFGGTRDHRPGSRSGSDAKTLVLKGATIFGGVSVRD